MVVRIHTGESDGRESKRIKQIDLNKMFVVFSCRLIDQSSDCSAFSCIFLRRLPNSDSAPKKHMNSSFRKDLGSKLKKAEETIDPFTSGGLNDEDALSDRPTFAHSKAPHLPVRSQHQPDPKDLKRNLSQRNNVGTSSLSHSSTFHHQPLAHSCTDQRRNRQPYTSYQTSAQGMQIPNFDNIHHSLT